MVKVYFKAFDVDDPVYNSDNDPNGVVDNESSMADNRSGDWGLSGGSATTDANEVASVDFRVSMQPGDNWRVVATVDPNGFSEIVAKQNDGINTGVYFGSGQAVKDNQDKTVKTKPLTTWRKLFLEVDKMGTVTGNTVTGKITLVHRAIAP